MSVLGRWVRLVALALVLGTAVGLVMWYRALGEARDATVAAVDARRAAFRAVMAQTPTPASTYAAIVGETHAPAWSELLLGAGVPQPLRGARPATLTAETRLVLLTAGSATDAEADALAEGGRMVVQVTDAPEPTDAAPPPWPTPLDVESSALRVRGAGVVLTLTTDWGRRLYERRQGRPDRRDRDTDGNGSLQPADLSATPGDVPATPESDLAVDRLLDRLESAAHCPLPRTRGLPAGKSAVVVLTSDQDYNPDELVEPLATRLAALGARATFLLTDPSRGRAPDLHVERVAGQRTAPTMGAGLRAQLLADGSGLGLHPFTEKPDEIRQIAQAFAEQTGFLALTARNHHVLWSGYMDIPRAEAEVGVALNLDWLPICAGTGPCAGFPGGSGRPMRFIDESGEALSILQQSTTVDDYSLRVADDGDRKRAALALTARSLELLDVAAGAELPLVVNAHPNLVILGDHWLVPLLERPGVVVMSAEQWLEFVVHRRQARITVPRCGAVEAELSQDVELRARGR